MTDGAGGCRRGAGGAVCAVAKSAGAEGRARPAALRAEEEARTGPRGSAGWGRLGVPDASWLQRVRLRRVSFGGSGFGRSASAVSFGGLASAGWYQWRAKTWVQTGPLAS
ncbi:hypothetical protein GCM10018965_089040 [Nonomuraea roseola]